MKADQLRANIIKPVLKDIDLYSRDAEELLILTAAQESHMGEYIKQINGPALGIYQMEPRTHDDIWSNYLNYKSGLSDKIHKWNLLGSFPYDNAYELCGNLYYATAMARVFYLRFNEPLPSHKDIPDMAKYYKQYWNTHLGAATIGQAIENYNKYA